MDKYAGILGKQTEIVLGNIDFTFSAIEDGLMKKEVNGFPVWRQMYHLLNSIDRIFTVPENYSYRDFHVDGLNSLVKQTEVELDKATLIKYFQGIKEQIRIYLDSLDDEKLLEEVICQEMRLTRFDLMLAQIRHITWHLGYLHACIKVETGSCPPYVGVSKEYYPI